MKSWKIRQILISYLFLLPTLIIMGVFIFYPMVKAFYLSLFINDYEGWVYVGLENYKNLLSDDIFKTSLLNSIKYLIVVPVIVVLSLALSMLVEPRLPAMNFFRACYYLPVVTSMVVVGITWRIIFNEDNGVLNQIMLKIKFIKSPIMWLTSMEIALYSVMSVTVWKGLGYYMVIFIAGLRSIPKEAIEASMIDGAKWYQQIIYVKIPMLWHSITLVAIVSSISALQVFEEIFVMTEGKPLHATSTLVFNIYKTGFDPAGDLRMGYASAQGVILFFLVLIFTYFSMKILKKGEYTSEEM